MKKTRSNIPFWKTYRPHLDYSYIRGGMTYTFTSYVYSIHEGEVVVFTNNNYSYIQSAFKVFLLGRL